MIETVPTVAREEIAMIETVLTVVRGETAMIETVLTVVRGETAMIEIVQGREIAPVRIVVRAAIAESVRQEAAIVVRDSMRGELVRQGAAIAVRAVEADIIRMAIRILDIIITAALMGAAAEITGEEKRAASRLILQMS